MKTLISLLVFYFSILIMNAQKSGKIIYEQKSKLNIEINSENAAALRNIPKEHISNKELIYDSTASLFQRVAKKNADEAIESETDHGRMVIKMDEPDEHIFCDLVGQKRIEQREFMSRMFLIEIPFTASTWKLTGNQRIILNYNCQEAILQDSVRKIKAWFTPAIPLATGPNGICNLPGLVLAAEMNGGEVTYEAKSIDANPVDHKLIVRPKDGKKVTRDEFNKLVQDKRKEMQDQGDGDGNMIIRIRK